MENHIRYLENLKKTADENIRTLDDWPSTITLRQTIDELLEIGMMKNKMPDTMRDYVAAQKALVDASHAREATLGRFRTLLEAQLGSSHQQMQTFNQRLEQIVRVSGGLILLATLLALLLAWGLITFHSFASGETFYCAQPGRGANWSWQNGCHYPGIWT